MEMKIILNEDDIKEAIVDLLEKKGYKVALGRYNIYLRHYNAQDQRESSYSYAECKVQTI